MKLVFAVIVTFNGEKWIKECLSKLVESTYPIKVIVVDNCSQDKTVSIIKEGNFKVNLIELPTNLGFGNANNKGIYLALSQKADYVFLLNQDAYIEKDTILHLVNTANEYKEFGLLSGIHFSNNKSSLDYNYSKQIIKCPGLISDKFINKMKPIYEIEFVNAAAWLISQESLEKVGGFDPLFFMYGEDNDLVNRLRYYKFKVGIVPSSYIIHDRNGEPHSISTQKKYVLLKANFMVRLKNINKGFLNEYLFLVLYALFSFAKSILSPQAASLYIKLLVNINIKIPQILASRRKTRNSNLKYIYIDPKQT